MTDDEKISQRYRELPREEPPRHLDDAILAAARRAANTRPAPLVVPSGRQRWYFPLAAAAIIVLAVAVTVHMEQEQPAEEIVAAQTAPAEAPSATREFKREEAAPTPQPERRQKAEAADSAQLPRELQAEPAPPAAPAPQLRMEQGARSGPQLSASAAQSPEQWLQGIIDLRGQGWHEEADRQLAEFRKRYPDYKIPETMLQRVERPR